MPFDGAGHCPTPVIKVLDQMLELFGPNGEYWIKNDLYRRNPTTNEIVGYCMVGAYYQFVPEGERKAIYRALGGPHITRRNDAVCTTFADIQRWIARVRRKELAKWEADHAL